MSKSSNRSYDSEEKAGEEGKLNCHQLERRMVTVGLVGSLTETPHIRAYCNTWGFNTDW